MKRHFCAVWRQAEKSKILVGRIRVNVGSVKSHNLKLLAVSKALLLVNVKQTSATRQNKEVLYVHMKQECVKRILHVETSIMTSDTSNNKESRHIASP